MGLFQAPTFGGLSASSEEVQNYLLEASDEVPTDIEEAIIDVFNDLRLTTQNRSVATSSIGARHGQRFQHAISGTSVDDEFESDAVPGPLHGAPASPVQFNASQSSNMGIVRAASVHSARSLGHIHRHKKTDSVLDPNSPFLKRQSNASHSLSPLKYTFQDSDDSQEALTITPAKDLRICSEASLIAQIDGMLGFPPAKPSVPISSVESTISGVEFEDIVDDSSTNRESGALNSDLQTIRDKFKDTKTWLSTTSNDCEVYPEPVLGHIRNRHPVPHVITSSSPQEAQCARFENTTEFEAPSNSEDDVSRILSLYGAQTTPQSFEAYLKANTPTPVSAPGIPNRRYSDYSVHVPVQQQDNQSNPTIASPKSSPPLVKRSTSVLRKAGAVSIPYPSLRTIV
jgi:hypothetical protein